MLMPWPLQKSWLSLLFMICITLPVFGFFLISNFRNVPFPTTSISISTKNDTVAKFINSNRIQQDLKANATLQIVNGLTTVPSKLTTISMTNKTLKNAKDTSSATSYVSTNSSAYLGTIGNYYEGGFSTKLDICSDFGKEIKLLIIVTSAPSHECARLAIRNTWGSFAKRKDVDLAFLLGSSFNETTNDVINNENDLYGDILRGNFVDSYDNLTLKTLAMHDWVITYCSEAKFILKTDDDMFIHVAKLLDFISKISPEKEALYGRVVKKWKPVRKKTSKYFLTEEQYKQKHFPDFTTGPAYLLPTQLSKKLFSAALNHTYIKLEDVFFNGILANDMKVPRKNNMQFMNRWVRTTPCNIKKVISVHPVTSSQQYLFWKLLHDNTDCSKNVRKSNKDNKEVNTII